MLIKLLKSFSNFLPQYSTKTIYEFVSQNKDPTRQVNFLKMDVKINWKMNFYLLYIISESFFNFIASINVKNKVIFNDFLKSFIKLNEIKKACGNFLRVLAIISIKIGNYWENLCDSDMKISC